MAGFLECDPSVLNGTKFGSEELTAAQHFLQQTIEMLAPDWSSAPKGPLARHWKSQGQYSASYLIHFAETLALLHGNLTEESVPILHDKIRSLFYPAGEASFEEGLVEIQVAATLSMVMSPVIFEPLVPSEFLDSSNKPSSPDFGLMLPETALTIEVTRWQWQAMQTWDTRASEVHRRLSDSVLRAGVRRNVQIAMAMPGAGADLDKVANRKILREICTKPSGELEIGTHGGSTFVQWTELPHFESPDADNWHSIPQGVVNWTAGDVAFPAIASSVQPIVSEQVLEAMVSSLRKAIDRKHRQTDPGLPHVLVLALGHHITNWEWILPIIKEQVLVNPKYSWISAFGAFSPARNWEIESKDWELRLIWNPNAAIAAPESLRAVAELGKTFHW